MAWKTALVIFLVPLLASCDDIRSVEICTILKRVDLEEYYGSCSKAGKSTPDKTIPQMVTNICMTQEDGRKVWETVQQCQQDLEECQKRCN